MSSSRRPVRNRICAHSESPDHQNSVIAVSFPSGNQSITLCFSPPLSRLLAAALGTMASALHFRIGCQGFPNLLPFFGLFFRFNLLPYCCSFLGYSSRLYSFLAQTTHAAIIPGYASCVADRQALPRQPDLLPMRIAGRHREDALALSGPRKNGQHANLWRSIVD